MENILHLEKRGCNFFKNDDINNLSDVGNYRVCAYDIIGKDGKTYFLEFGSCDKRAYRKTNKRTGAPLKHPKFEIVLKNALHISTQFEDETGCYGNIELERNLYKLGYTYTLENILKVVNRISVVQYDRIEFL